jgi:hypothetical protein
MRAQSQFMLRSHGRTSSDEFGCLRCVLYVRGGAVAASSQYLVLLGSPFEYLLEDVGLLCRIIVRPGNPSFIVRPASSLYWKHVECWVASSNAACKCYANCATLEMKIACL